MKKKKLTHEEILRAIQEFEKVGGLIRVLDAQIDLPRLGYEECEGFWHNFKTAKAYDDSPN